MGLKSGKQTILREMFNLLLSMVLSRQLCPNLVLLTLEPMNLGTATKLLFPKQPLKKPAGLFFFFLIIWFFCI